MSFPPFCLRLIPQVSHLLTYNFRIPKTYFFFPKFFSLNPRKTPLSLKKWIFKLLRLPCCWYSKLVPWDTDRSWKGIGLIRSLSPEKTSKTYQIVGNFQQLSNRAKIWIFWHVLDVFSVLGDWIKLILFHEQPVSQDTHLEYQQQGYRSNLKIHFFKLTGVFRGVKEKNFGKKKYFLGILKL